MAVLAAQGFKNQLDQYELLDDISGGSRNPVFLGIHRISGMKVAVKVMKDEKSSRYRHENGITEASAMKLCNKSENVGSLIETFSQCDRVYIVTKYYKAGNLLDYILNRGRNNLPEA